MKVLNRSSKKAINVLFETRVTESTLPVDVRIKISEHLFKIKKIDKYIDDSNFMIFNIGKKLYRIHENNTSYGDSKMTLQKFQNGAFRNTKKSKIGMYKDSKDLTIFMYDCLTFKDKDAKRLEHNHSKGFYFAGEKRILNKYKTISSLLSAVINTINKGPIMFDCKISEYEIANKTIIDIYGIDSLHSNSILLLDSKGLAIHIDDVNSIEDILFNIGDIIFNGKTGKSIKEVQRLKRVFDNLKQS